jgi:hypothetical protein
MGHSHRRGETGGLRGARRRGEGERTSPRRSAVARPTKNPAGGRESEEGNWDTMVGRPNWRPHENLAALARRRRELTCAHRHRRPDRRADGRSKLGERRRRRKAEPTGCYKKIGTRRCAARRRRDDHRRHTHVLVAVKSRGMRTTRGGRKRDAAARAGGEGRERFERASDDRKQTRSRRRTRTIRGEQRRNEQAGHLRATSARAGRGCSRGRQSRDSHEASTAGPAH